MGREVARREGFQWMEYWEFLQDFADFSSDEGLSQLEAFLQSRSVYVFGLM